MSYLLQSLVMGFGALYGLCIVVRIDLAVGRKKSDSIKFARHEGDTVQKYWVDRGRKQDALGNFRCLLSVMH